MRRLRSLTALLPLIVAPVLLAGCGGSDSEESASSSSSSPSSSSSSASSSADEQSSADAEKQETFCREVPGVLSEITDDLNGVATTPEQAPALLTEAVDKLSAVEPPEGAKPQWDRMVAAATSMRDIIAGADLTNPQGNADLAPQIQSLQTELIDAGTAIDDYGQANC